MLEKIKSFFRKNKKVVIIVSVFLGIILLVFLLTLGEDQEEEREDGIVPSEEIEYRSLFENYNINLSTEVVQELNKYAGDYGNFEIEIRNHVDWVDNFAKDIKQGELEYRETLYPVIKDSELHTLDQSHYFWESDEDVVFYDVASDYLFFNFETPSNISNLLFNPSEEESVEEALNEISERFFSGDFEYRVDNIDREGNFYKIEYNRMLDEVPILTLGNELYLLVTPDGRFKEGRFLLAEFRNFGRTNVISGDNLSEVINNKDFFKSVEFKLKDTSLYEDLVDAYGDFRITGDETAQVDAIAGELYYYYRDKFHELVHPRFKLLGEGLVQISNDEFEASFNVITDSSL